MLAEGRYDYTHEIQVSIIFSLNGGVLGCTISGEGIGEHVLRSGLLIFTFHVTSL